MKRNFFILILSSLIVVACENNKTEDITEQCEFPDNFLGTCFYGVFDYTHDNIIITNSETYQDFADSIRIHPANINCDTAGLPIIDFNKYSLLGLYTSGGGCDASFVRQIIDDPGEHKIIYKVKASYEGACYMLIFNYNWAIIPKLEEGYSVEFHLD